MNQVNRIWPADAAALERIWYGPHWLYCGLEAETPTTGDFKTTTLGERPVIVVRSGEDQVSVVENRCAHRGVKYGHRSRHPPLRQPGPHRGAGAGRRARPAQPADGADLIDKQTDIVLSAICHDLVVRDEGRLRFRERIVVFDSEMVPNSLIYSP